MDFFKNAPVDSKNGQNHGSTMAPFITRLSIMLLFLLGASFIGYSFKVLNLQETNIAIVYLLAVLLTARYTGGYFFGFWVSLFAAFFFNFLFMEPYYTFSVNTPSYIITFIIMAITALITSTLTTHAKQNALKAREREIEAKTLYSLTNRLTDAADIHEIAGIAASTVCDMLNCNVGCVCYNEFGKPEQTFTRQFSPKNPAQEEEVGQKSFFDWLISGRDSTLGVIRIPMEAAKTMTLTQSRTLQGLIENTALAMDRFHAAEQRRRSNEAIVQKHYRGNLLQAISHDLRTPLTF